MLILSDMSGQSMVSGFRAYLTGYPLQDETAYAFGKTWYAPEMDRPGCVWTHTLVIEFSDVPLIKNPWRLLTFFRRPEGNKDLSCYEHGIDVLLSEVRDASDMKSDCFGSTREFVEHILSGLYGSPGKPVFITADTSEEFEGLILAIWNQQWPRLRRSFSFCTGSISNRKLDGRFFDLQVVPWTSFENIKRELPDAMYVNVDDSRMTSSLPNWVSVAADDLLRGNNANLKKFLWNFGADQSNGRDSYLRLAQVFSALEKVRLGDLAISEIIESLAKLYPNKTAGIRLKAAILGSQGKANTRFSTPFEEIELLSELCVTNKHRAFDKKSLSIRKRAAALWVSEPSKTRNLVLRLCNTSLNPIGEDFLIGFSEAIDTTGLISLSRDEPSLLYVLITKNPALAASEKVWSLPAGRRRSVIDAIMDSRDIPEEVLGGIVNAILEAGVSDGADQLPRISERCVIKSILDWFDSRSRLLGHDPNVPSRWLNSLRLRSSLLLDWLRSAKSPSEHSIALLAGILDPHSREVLDYGTNVWLPVPKSSFHNLDEATLSHTMSFLLALGFNNAGSEGHKLVAAAYQTVYDATENDELTHESWRLLVDLVPSLPWWRNWDKCERLRIAIAEKFIYYGWPLESFLTAIRRNETFEQVVNSLRHRKTERELLDGLAEGIKKGVVLTNAFRRKVLLDSL
jgi:hypothetical protein